LRGAGGIEERCVDTVFAQACGLILHQGDEGADHDTGSLHSDGGELVAERFASTRRHDDRRIAATDDGLDDCFLLGPEFRIAPVAAQKGMQVRLQSRPLSSVFARDLFVILAGRESSTLAGFALCDLLIELRGLITRDAEAAPAFVPQVFGKKYDLTDVIGVVAELSMDRLRHRVSLAPNGDAAGEVGVGQGLERAEHTAPAVVPCLQNFGLSCGCIHEFGVPVASYALAVGIGEPGPAGEHVPGEMFDNDRDRVHLRIERGLQLRFVELSECPIAELFVIAEKAEGVRKARGGELECHASILAPVADQVSSGDEGVIYEQVIAMNLERLKRITIEEGKCGGRPCIRGLRFRVSDLLELLAAGADFDEILRDYDFLEREDILAAIEYAAHQADHTVLQAS
jgi:uncharacterized protein (DUF433 family)